MRLLSRIEKVSRRFDESELGAAMGVAALFGLLIIGLWLTPSL